VLEPSKNCALSPCVKLLAGAWTLEIIFYLKDKPFCFGDLRRILDGVSAKVLSARLRGMEEQGVVVRRVIHGTPPNVEYSLSEMGSELIPVLDLLSDVSLILREKYKSKLV